MSDNQEQAARKLARGPAPSVFVAGSSPAGQGAGDPPEPKLDGGGEPPTEAPFDPLRLCIFATIAILGWIFGPLAVLVFAGVGFAGYWRARQAGLTRSKCYLRDTRLVLAYLFALAAAGAVGLGLRIQEWLF